jgi:nucleotide-binding universal stress UspA family protein
MTTCHDPYDEDLQPQDLVVGVDGSPGSRAALGWALDHGRASGARVVAVNVVEPVTPLEFAGAGFGAVAPIDTREVRRAAREVVDRIIRDMSIGRQTNVQTHVIEGHNPGQVLVRASRNASMLVVGAHHRQGLGVLLGSTGASCVRHATCPVVVIPESWRRTAPSNVEESREVLA